MIQSSVTQYDDPPPFHGTNLCIRDAMELCQIDLIGLSSLFCITEDKCLAKLNREMIIPAKKSWIEKIFQNALGDQVPYFTSFREWEDFINQELATKGSEWMEGPFVIEGSRRHIHQIVNKTIFADRHNSDRQKGVKNVKQ